MKCKDKDGYLCYEVCLRWQYLQKQRTSGNLILMKKRSHLEILANTPITVQWRYLTSGLGI